MDAKFINSTTDLTALAPNLRKMGRYHVGPCPFCGGRDRFNIKHAEDGDLWICRGCGDGHYQDAVAFLMRQEGKSFKEIVAAGQPTGLRPGWSAAPPRPARPPAIQAAAEIDMPPDEGWQIHALAALSATISAANDPLYFQEQTELEYLMHYRGLSLETIRRAQLGFSRHIIRVSDERWLLPGLVIPCMVDGELWYVKVRLSRNYRAQQLRDPGKYSALQGSKLKALYNADALAGAQTALVVEGEFDVLLVSQYLPEGWAAVTMGSATSLPGPAFLPYFAGVERVLLRLDTDTAGETGLAGWGGLLRHARVLPPFPDGSKDFTEFNRNGGDIKTWLLSL